MGKKILVLGEPNTVLLVRWLNKFDDNGWEVHNIFSSRNIEGINTNINLKKLDYVKRSNIALLFRVLFYGIKIRQAISKIKPDIIWVHTQDWILYTLFLDRKLPFVYTLWGAGLLKEYKNIKWYQPLFFMRKLIEKKAISQVNTITSESGDLAESFAKIFPDFSHKIRLVKWGINSHKFRKKNPSSLLNIKEDYGIQDNNKVIISARTTHPFYNTKIIFKSALEIVKKYKNVKYIFLRGTAPDKSYEKEIIDSVPKKFSNNFIFVKHRLKENEMVNLYNISSIYIGIPPHDDVSACLIESMSIGCIPVVSDIPTNRNLISDAQNGFLVKVNTSSEGIVKNLYTATSKALNTNFNKVGKLNKNFIKKHYNFNRDNHEMVELMEKLAL